MNELEQNVVEAVSSGHTKKNRKFDIVALILCLVVALSIWLYVENINQDIIEKEIIVTFDAKKQVFEETGMYIFSGNEDLDYSQVEVKLTVSGSKAVLEKYDDSEYIVELDTSGITQAGGRYGVYFKYRLPSDEIQYKSIVATAYTSSLMLIDDSKELDVPLRADYEDVPAKKESIITCTPKTDKISISGPASMVNEINNVVAIVNVNSLTESTTVKSKTFEFFGEDGSPILLNGSYITLTPTEVEVDVTIKYVNESVKIAVQHEKTQIDTYIYEVMSVNLDNVNFTGLYFDGDSVDFPDNELVWTLDLAKILESGDYPEGEFSVEISVGDFIKDYGVFDGYKKLTLHNQEDSQKEISVKISKTLVNDSTMENPEPDDTGNESGEEQ